MFIDRGLSDETREPARGVSRVARQTYGICVPFILSSFVSFVFMYYISLAPLALSLFTSFLTRMLERSVN